MSITEDDTQNYSLYETGHHLGGQVIEKEILFPSTFKIKRNPRKVVMILW